MKNKIKKLLFEYSRNSRITTKELGRKIGTSQQSASYLLNSLKKKKLISGTATIIDAIKLGYINVIVGFYILNPSLKNEIIEELSNNPNITSIEEGKEGLDLLVEFTVQNLSAFNKIHSEIIYIFYQKLKSVFIYPTIVSHEYNRNYLSRKFQYSDMILFGDRILRDLSENELLVLEELVKNTDEKLINISETLNIPVKTIIGIKKSLEKKFIIKGYTSILNHSKLGIKRQIILLRFSGEGIGQIDKFYDFTRHNKNIIKFMKLIGEYQSAIFVESLTELDIINDIRLNFLIENYRIIKSERIHKKTYLPLSENK